jgi:hypothetical protein
MNGYWVPHREARDFYGVSDSTIRRWASTNKIVFKRTPSGQRTYFINDKTCSNNQLPLENTILENYVYCRVSSNKQKDDLERQIQFLSNKYPGYKIIKDIGAGILKLFEGAVNMVIDGINGLLNAFFNGLGGGIADAVSVFSGGTVNLKKPGLISKVKFQIPGLAEGGTVMPSRGGSLVNVAEAGQAERIEPLDENGLSKRDKVLIAALSSGSGSGSTINVYPSAGMNERDLADMVSRRIAFEIRKGAF